MPAALRSPEHLHRRDLAPMSLRSRVESQEADRSPRYLPYLTWLLLAMLFAYLLSWYFFSRTPTTTEQEMTSIVTAMEYIKKNYVEPVDQRTLYEGAMRGMIAALNNKYSYYMDPSQWQSLNEQTEGEYVGIGVRIRPADGWAVVAEVFPNGPAAKAGVRVGDIIASVAGHEAHEMSAEDLVDLIRGKRGSDVHIVVRRPPGQTLIPLVVVRGTVEVPSAQGKMSEDGIGLLSIESFDRNVAQQARAALLKLRESGLRGLVVDLRGNPGGLMDQAVAVCNMFLDKGLILRLEGRQPADVPPPDFADADTVIPTTVPMVVLVDRSTASAAEILSGALQANHRAVVIGARTFGKGSVTQLLPLKDGSGIVLTVYHYVLAGGELIEGHGVTPDIEVGVLPPYPTDDQAKAEAWHRLDLQAQQQQQQRALQYLRQKLGIPEPAPEPAHATDAH
jgi:carboxyl-terminal processing protease